MPDFLSITWWRKFYTRVGRTFGMGCALVFAIPLVIGFGWNQFAGRGGGSSNQSVDTNAVIATVNGTPITKAQFLSARPMQGAGTGEKYAQTQGAIMNELVQFAVIQQLAKKYNVHVNDADVDRKMADEREQRLGKNVTDAQWEEYVARAHNNMTPGEYRDSLTKDPQMLAPALLTKFQSMENVTPEEIKKYNAEVKLRLVKINYGPERFGDPKKPKKTLTEAEAKKKAEDLLAKAKAGANLADLAKANSDDFTKAQGGDAGWTPEFRTSSGPMGGPEEERLASSYSKEFADSVHKTAKGQFTDVIKTSAFGESSFTFAKVEDRRDSAPAKPDPKNPMAEAPITDPKKIAETLKQQRASAKVGNEFKTAINTAQVVFKPEGQDEKAYYDYYKVQEMQSKIANAAQMKQFGMPVEPGTPTQADVDKQKALADVEIEALYKKHPQDSNLALIVAKNLKSKMELAQSSEKAALRDRLIALYETALQGTEDRNIRFDLADLYRDKGDTVKAEAAYKKIDRLMNIAPGFDTASLKEEQFARKRLVSGFTALNKPAEADAQKQKVSELDFKIQEATFREAHQRNSQMPPGMENMIPPGGTGSTLTVPRPKSTGKKKP